MIDFNMLKIEGLTLKGGLSKDLIKDGSIKEITERYTEYLNPDKIVEINSAKELKLSEVAGKGFLKKLKLKDRKVSTEGVRTVTVLVVEIKMACNSKISGRPGKTRYVKKKQNIITLESKSSIQDRLREIEKESKAAA
jgi:hypothetical protein